MPQSQNHRIFENTMSISKQSIYHEKDYEKSIPFITNQSRTRIKCGHFIQEQFDTPHDAHPIDIIGSSHKFSIATSYRFIPQKPIMIRTLEEYINKINEYIK